MTEVVIFIGILFGLFVWIKWGLTHKNRIGYILLPTFYLLHSLLFYTLSSLRAIPIHIYSSWTSLLYIHGLIVIIAAPILMLYIAKEVK